VDFITLEKSAEIGGFLLGRRLFSHTGKFGQFARHSPAYINVAGTFFYQSADIRQRRRFELWLLVATPLDTFSRRLHIAATSTHDTEAGESDKGRRSHDHR
jgi:hypothetical protein